MFARIGVMALNAGEPNPVVTPRDCEQLQTVKPRPDLEMSVIRSMDRPRAPVRFHELSP
jgi:hypothetical protein